MISNSLDIIIHPNAVVAVSSQISIETDLPPASTSLSPPVNIKLIVAGGNLFHPHSRVILIPPSAESHNTPTQNNGQGLVVRIGENNVFEEECNIILDLRKMKESTSEEGSVINIIGSYNQFAPRSYVRSNHIGNANIFQPMCHLDIPNIKNGNIFGSTLQVNIGANDLFLVDDNHDATNFFQEKVMYMVSDKQTEVNRQVVRPHDHGMKRNMRVVGLVLGATRNIVQMNHRLMAETPDVSSLTI